MTPRNPKPIPQKTPTHREKKENPAANAHIRAIVRRNPRGNLDPTEQCRPPPFFRTRPIEPEPESYLEIAHRRGFSGMHTAAAVLDAREDPKIDLAGGNICQVGRRCDQRTRARASRGQRKPDNGPGNERKGESGGEGRGETGGASLVGRLVRDEFFSLSSRGVPVLLVWWFLRVVR